jgi:hypothetical protein
MKNYRYLSGNVLIFNHSRQIETLEFFFSSWSFAWFLRFIKISRALRQQNKNHKPRDGNGGTSHEGRTEGRTKGVRYGHHISGWCLALVTSFGTDNLFSSWELRRQNRRKDEGGKIRSLLHQWLMSCSCYFVWYWQSVFELGIELFFFMSRHVLPVPSYIAVCLFGGVLAWDRKTGRCRKGGCFQGACLFVALKFVLGECHLSLMGECCGCACLLVTSDAFLATWGSAWTRMSL